MPQLMALNWIFSSSIFVMLLFSACIVYSDVMKQMMILDMKKGDSKKSNMWCW